jgi:predicted flap endonuclease-1-like 5' DNA nuclease
MNHTQRLGGKAMFRKTIILLGSLIVSLGLAAFSGSSRPVGQVANAPAWIQVLLILAIVVIFVLLEVLLVWWLRRRSTAAPATMPQPKVEAPAPAVKIAPPMPAVESAPSAPDDLKLIEGIGPKIAGILAAAGITTFAQLGATDVSRLKEIIAQAGLTALADPATWPEQAALAAAGKLDELKALQGQLKGGRQVDKSN